MSLITLRDLYVAELSDLYAAERQLLQELPLLSAGATSDELRETFDTHYRQTLRHIDRLETLFEHLEERPRVTLSRALRALIEESRTRNALLPPGRELDAALIAEGQRLEHYEIAAYRCARTYAMSLADALGINLLQETLDEEGGMDQKLMELAMAGSLTGTGHLRVAS